MQASMHEGARRLGGAPGLLAPCPPKPRGMLVPTYARLLDQALAVELAGGKAGSYGFTANGASAIAPSPAPTPSVSASPSATPTPSTKKKAST